MARRRVGGAGSRDFPILLAVVLALVVAIIVAIFFIQRPQSPPASRPAFSAPMSTPWSRPALSVPVSTPWSRPAFSVPVSTPWSRPVFSVPVSTPWSRPVFSAPVSTPTSRPGFSSQPRVRQIDIGLVANTFVSRLSLWTTDETIDGVKKIEAVLTPAASASFSVASQSESEFVFVRRDGRVETWTKENADAFMKKYPTLLLPCKQVLKVDLATEQKVGPWTFWAAVNKCENGNLSVSVSYKINSNLTQSGVMAVLVPPNA